MSQPRTASVVAYLSPQLPSLSETFVYEELLGVLDRGISVLPVSVHRARAAPPGAPARRLPPVHCLYGRTPLVEAAAALLRLPSHLPRLPRALRWLASDLRETGLHRAAGWKLLYQFCAGIKLAGLLIEHRCQHLHVHFAHVPAQIAMYASALSGVPYTVTAHANDIFQRGHLLRQKAERAKRVVAISEFNRDFLQRCGVPPAKVSVVRCGPSFQAAQPQPRASAAVPCIGTLGRLVEKKGMDVLIEAIAELHRRAVPVRLAIAGEGPCRGALEAKVRELGLQAQVQFAGALAHAEVAAWMRSLDVFALASKPDKDGDMDGIPVVLVEAMSQAVPVVSTRLSGIPELVVHDRTGLLAEPADPVDLADQLERLLRSQPLRETLTRNAVAHVKTEFGREVNLDRLIALFATPSA